MKKIKIRISIVAVAVGLSMMAATGTASAARPQPDRTSIVSMARYNHCDILATPGPDWFRGHIVRGWIIGVERKAYFVIAPASVGWEGPVGPRGRMFVKAVCQFGPGR